MSGVHFPITGDNSNFIKAIQGVNREIQNTSKIVEQNGGSIDSVVERLTGGLKKLGVAFSVQQLISNIANVRGEFQKLEVAFTTILGSAEKANSLMTQLTKTAAITPFGLQDVAGGAKQLLAYGLEAERVNDTLIRLGDIAAGLSIPLGDLVYLYGTTMTQGMLFTQDMRQFMGRGIPLAEELAKQFGVTKDKVGELVTEGKVGFNEVERAIVAMTSEGGKFGGLMEEQSKTIEGQISNIKDAFDVMFNNMGKSTEGIINKALQGVSYAVEHYEQFGRILLGLVGTYGAYKTACMAVTAIQGLQTLGINKLTASEAIHYGWLVVTKKAQELLNITMLKNPYVLVATLIAGVVAVMISMKTEAELIAEAEEKYNEELQKSIEKEKEHKNTINELISVSQNHANSLDTRLAAMRKLAGEYPDIFAKYDTEIEKLNKINEIQKEIEERERVEAIKKEEDELKNVNRRIIDLQNIKKSTLQVQTVTGAGYTTTGRDRTAEENAELTFMLNKREELNNKRARRIYDYFLNNIGSYELEFIEEARQQLEDLRFKMQTFGIEDSTFKTDGILESFGVNVKLSKKEVESAIERLDSMINTLNEPRLSSKEIVEKYKKIYEDAFKRYNDFVTNSKNKLITPEFIKEAERLKSELDVAEKEYQKYLPKTDKDSEKAEEKKKREQKEREKREKDINKTISNLRQKNTDESINQLEEGYEKTLAVIDNAYNKTIKEIESKENELKEKRGGTLSDEEQGVFDTARILAEKRRNIEIANAQKTALEGLDEYKSYDEKRRDIDKKYYEDIALLQKLQNEKIAKGENTLDIGGRMSERYKAYKEELAELNKEVENIVQKAPLLERLFADSSKMSVKSLRDVTKEVKILLNYLTGVSTVKPEGVSDEQLAKLKENVGEWSTLFDNYNKMVDEIDKKTSYPFSSLINGFKLLKKSGDTAQEALEATDKEGKKLLETQSKIEKDEGMSKLADGAVEIADAFSSVTDILNKFADAIPDEKLKETAEKFSSISSNLTAAAQGAASGGWIGAIVGGVTDIITQTVDAVVQNEIEQEELLQNTRDFAREYELLQLSINDKDYDNIFGISSIEKAQDAYEKATKALELYKEEVNKSIDGSNYKGDRSKIAIYEKAYREGYNALQGMAVKTLDRSAWANLWGAEDEYTSLKDLAPQLWGEDGAFNVDAAKKFLETNTQLTNEQRKQIENVIELKDTYDEAMSEIESQLNNVFGNLSSDLTDIIFNSVENGTDAWKDFEKVGGEIIHNLGKQLMQEMLIGSFLKQYEDDLINAYSLENPQQEVAKITAQMMNDAKGMIPTWQQAAEDWNAAAEAMGYSYESGEDYIQSASSKGFQTMSQDSADELNGRFTALQIAGEEIRNTLSLLRTDLFCVQDIRDIVMLNNSHLEDIATYTKHLIDIKSDISKVVTNTSRI